MAEIDFQKPLVSIIIPCRNEEKFIGKCLDSVLVQDYPKDKIEVLVVNGQSTDRTRAIVEEYAQRYPFIRLLDNPGKIQSCALNIGIRNSKGELIVRLDAHSHYPKDYLKLCLETAERTKANNTGGVLVTLPGNNSYQAQVIQAMTTNKFGVGDSGFRTGEKEGEADTVPFGCFRRELFERIGFFDERLVRAQDYEINRRIIASGGKVWRNPNIKVFYHNQSDLFSFYKKQILKQAPYNAYLWYLAMYAFALRHAITGAFALGVLIGLFLSIFFEWVRFTFFAVMGLYCLLAVFSALQQSIRYKQWRHVFSLPICFFLFHFLHGLGVLWGVMRLLTHTAPVQKIKEPWSGAGRFRAWPIN